MMPKHEIAALNGIDLHVAHHGSGRPIIFLHGFPAFSYVWEAQLAQFGQSMWAIAPDGRGVNLSSKPVDVAAYQLAYLAADVVALADYLAIEQFVLVGHDWGGAVAWEVARRYPQRVSDLIVANAPPWAAFMHALATLPEQRAASEYVERLKADSAEARLLANDAETLWQVSMAPLVEKGAYSDEHKAHFIKCWLTPGSLTGFLNWYRANVPAFEDIDAAEFRPKSAHQIMTRTLLLWGEHERAFTRALLNSIPSYAPNVSIEIVADANHWIHLERPDYFYSAITAFLAQSDMA